MGLEAHAAARAVLAAAFGVLAVFCGYLVLRDRRGAAGGAASSSASLQAHARRGFDARVSFHRFMLLAALSRTASLAVELSVDHREDDDLRGWWNESVHAFPAFLFFTTYSLLLMLWAQLVHSLGRVDVDGARSVAPYYVALNGTVWTVFVGTAAITAMLREYRPFPRLVLYTVGVVDALAALGFVVYGARVARVLGSRDATSIFSTRQRILRRVVAICVVCTTAFLFRGVYSLLVAADVVDSFYAVRGVGHAAWEAIFLAATELVPSAVVLALTLQRRGGGGGGAGRGGDGYEGLVGDDAVERQGRTVGDYPNALLSVADDLDDLDGVDGGAFG